MMDRGGSKREARAEGRGQEAESFNSIILSDYIFSFILVSFSLNLFKYQEGRDTNEFVMIT